jgi:hypothetical protein
MQTFTEDPRFNYHIVVTLFKILNHKRHALLIRADNQSGFTAVAATLAYTCTPVVMPSCMWYHCGPLLRTFCGSRVCDKRQQKCDPQCPHNADGIMHLLYDLDYIR